MSRKEPEGWSVDAVVAFLEDFFAGAFVTDSLEAAGEGAEFTSADVFSVRAFLGAGFEEAFLAGGLSPGLIAG